LSGLTNHAPAGHKILIAATEQSAPELQLALATHGVWSSWQQPRNRDARMQNFKHHGFVYRTRIPIVSWYLWHSSALWHAHHQLS